MAEGAVGTASRVAFSSAATKLLECRATKPVARLIVRRFESMPKIEASTRLVAMIDGQAEVVVTVIASGPGDVAQQLFTNPGAAEFLVDEQVLDVQARLAQPRRKHREVKADGGDLAVDLGQHPGKLAPRTEPGGFNIFPRAFQAPGNAEGLSQQPKRQQDLFAILAFGHPE